MHEQLTWTRFETRQFMIIQLYYSQLNKSYRTCYLESCWLGKDKLICYSLLGEDFVISRGFSPARMSLEEAQTNLDLLKKHTDSCYTWMIVPATEAVVMQTESFGSNNSRLVERKRQFVLPGQKFTPVGGVCPGLDYEEARKPVSL